MSRYIVTQHYIKDYKLWIRETTFTEFEKAKEYYNTILKKYEETFHFKNKIKITENEYNVNKLIRTNKDNQEEKAWLLLNKAQEYRCPTSEEIEEAAGFIDNKEILERGYDIFNYDNTGLLEIEAVNDLWNMTDEACAYEAEKTGFCKIIPVDELPKKFPRRYFGWIDTPENRENIEKYTKEYNKNISTNPPIFE